MTILGIDPGFTVTGFALLTTSGGTTVLIDTGYLKLPASSPLDQRIHTFYQTLQHKIVAHNVTHLSLETPFLGKNTQSFLKLGYLRGVLYLLAAQHNLMLLEFSPREVKLAVTGFGGASKEQVANMVARLFPMVQRLGVGVKADVTDAIAVSLSGLWQQRKRV